MNAIVTTSEFKFSKRLLKLRTPPLPASVELLRSSMIQFGMLTPLTVAIVGDEHFLVDGHTRLQLAQELSIDPPISTVTVSDQDELDVLFAQFQIGHGSLSDIGSACLRGQIYLARKQQGRAITSRHNGEKSKTSNQLAKQLAVSPRTLERDAQVAGDVNAIEATLGESARNSLCSGEVKANRRDIHILARLDIEEMRARFEDLKAGRSIRRARSPQAGQDFTELETDIDTVEKAFVDLLESNEDGEDAKEQGSEDKRRTGGSKPTRTKSVAEDEDDGDDEGDDEGDDDDDEVTETATPTGSNGPKHSPGSLIPAIFQDVDDLKAATTLLGEAADLLKGVMRGWEFEPGHDVEPVVDVLRDVIDLVGEAFSTLDESLVPREVCTGCNGVGCDDCIGCGWLSKGELDG